MKKGISWDLNEQLIKRNVERSTIDESEVQNNFGIDDMQMHNCINKMRKRHPNDKWIGSRENLVERKMVRTIFLEGVDWIVNVYFRDKAENYLDAEIKFTLKHIKRLEQELNIVPELKSYEDQSMYSLAKDLKVDYKTLKANICKKEKEDNEKYIYQNEKNITTVKGQLVQEFKLNQNKKFRFKELNDYKIKLQQEKAKRRNKK